MSNPEQKRSRFGPMLDRIKLIALGLTLGIGAKYVVRYWPATKASDQPAAVKSANEASERSK